MNDLDEDRITELATYQFPTEQMEACTVQKDFLKSENHTVPFIYDDLVALENHRLLHKPHYSSGHLKSENVKKFSFGTKISLGIIIYSDNYNGRKNQLVRMKIKCINIILVIQQIYN